MPRNVKIEFFHQNRIDLYKEIKNHPKLQELLEKHPINEIEMRIAEVSAYCGIILHGDYLQSDLDALCGRLRNHLICKRTGLTFIN